MLLHLYQQVNLLVRSTVLYQVVMELAIRMLTVGKVATLHVLDVRYTITSNPQMTPNSVTSILVTMLYNTQNWCTKLCHKLCFPLQNHL